MMRKLFMFVLAGCLALFAVGVSAQTLTTGSLEGTITDVNGAAVPGVTITATRQGGSPKTATSNAEGRYSFPQLEPGKYKVTVEATKGVGKFEENVDVSLGKTSDFTVQLSPPGASATVNVTAGAGAALDVTANTTGTNVSTEQFSNFPTQRTVQSLYTIAPTVARSGLRDSSGRDRDPSVGGSSGPENNYILDGVGVSDPAFGGSGGNLPFEFVQEIETKTGAYGAEYGKSTGGIFNVITKSGTNDIRGDAFAYFTTKGLVRETKDSAIPKTGSAPNGFSEIDAGFDIGGPIKKDNLYFFGAFNPQRRQNYFLTQTFLNSVHNKVTTPFYSGKITWQVNQNNTFNFSTFGDFTKQEGFLFGGSGFGANPNSFRGEIQTGGSNYAGRLNSTITPNWIGEFSAGLHFQRANTIPDASVADQALVTDRFAVLRNGAILTPTDTTVTSGGPGTLRLAFVEGSGGTIQRNFVRQGFGLRTNQNRNRYEAAARLQNIWGKNTIKYGVELNQNRYRIDTRSTGPTQNFGAAGTLQGFRVENRFAVCSRTGNTVSCPSASRTANVQALINAGALAGTGITTAVTNAAATANLNTIANPFLVLDVVRVRDFRLTTHGDFSTTNTESFYIQDDYKLTKDVQLNLGLRWDYQQSKASNTSYFKLNNFHDNMQPRLGIIWDFTGEGRGKIFANYAKFVETPLPLDLNVRAGGDSQQIDVNLNASQLNASPGSITLTNFGNLGGDRTPIDPGLKPQTVNQ